MLAGNRNSVNNGGGAHDWHRRRAGFRYDVGAEDDSCYVGSYMMTWTPQDDDGWQLQAFGWQDVETALENCK